VKDPLHFTFNAKAIKVPSARQLVYGDVRAKGGGRLPDDTWILRPQDMTKGFEKDEDTWYYPRVCGTFKERAGFHGCQMPERVLGRIIEVSSNPGELVLDPFGGSGGTLIVAKKLRRDYLGFEFSDHYAERIRERLDATAVGQALDGVEDPKTSVPNTENGRRLEGKTPGRKRRKKTPEATNGLFTPDAE
jgi:site-specific DNA-methyltransferase (adenine-specific)